MLSEKYPYKHECYYIIGCAMDVQNELGHGFLEAVYQEALEINFIEKEIPYEREKELNIYFKGKLLNKRYYADFFCYNKIIVELKASSGLTDADIGQVINYLKATEAKIGLLFNFGLPSLQYKRIIF
ncbi:MAG: GxxExxY protein [Prevotella sp.]|nr:GxxExxY protein [Prevotella sp.]